MNRVIHFEIHATEPERVGKFYTDLFGWKIEEWKLHGVKEENRYLGGNDCAPEFERTRNKRRYCRAEWQKTKR